MKLSQKTISLLKNFATINPSIVFEEGTRLRTISEIKNVLADADIEENIPATFGIYDLNKFLGVVSNFDEPVLDIQDKYVNVTGEGSRQKFKFFFSDPANLTAPKADLNLPGEDITFELSASDLSAIKRAAQTLGAKDLVIEPTDNDELNLTITDLKDNTANSSTLTIPGAYSKDSFKIIINTDNLKMIPGDYSVAISGKILTKFASDDVTYYIAVEHTSKY